MVKISLIRTTGTIIFIVFSLIISSAQNEIRFMEGSLKAALSIAKERGQSVFIDTYADWCKPCKRMDIVFKDPDVAMFYNEHFLNLKVNMQNSVKASELRRKYDVVFLPSMFIVDYNGVVKYQVDHELTRDEMLNIGQMMLDPNSYNVSDATAIRRNDGTMAATKPSYTTPPQPTLPKTTPAKPPVKIEEVKIIDPTPKKIVEPMNQAPETIEAEENGAQINDVTSSPAAAKPQNKNSAYLDQFETISETKSKVLMVLDAGVSPPSEVLMLEAYSRLELMDGSHKAAATEYLGSQDDWNTEENRKFILDFVDNTHTKEYQFIIDNKLDFITQFGKERVTKSLEILTYRTLFNAVPRPSLNDTKQLYENLGIDDVDKTAKYYFISRLIAEDNKKELLKLSKKFFENYKDQHGLMYSVANYLLSVTDNKKELKFATKLLESAVKINPKSILYLNKLKDAYLAIGKEKKSNKIELRLSEIESKTN
ncbi:MAG: thioredoxin family protein [Saprospiraceae bacterium]